MKLRLLWRWYAMPALSVAGLAAAVLLTVASRTAFDYARSLERPTPGDVAALPVVSRSAQSLAAAAENVLVRAPTQLNVPIPTLELVVNPEELSLLGTRSAKTAKLEVDGQLKAGGAWRRVNVRLRGDNIFHWGAELRSYAVEFRQREAVSGQTELNLVNPKDATALSIPFGEHTARRLGVAAADSQPCRFMLNGDNQGVYLCQQPINAAWLRNTGRPEGSIFTGDYLVYGYGANLASALRLWDAASLWQTETKDLDRDEYRAALSDVLALWREIAQAPPGADAAALRTRLERAVDVDAFLRLWSVQSWSDSLHQDEFHNWRLYFDPSDGRFRPIVWDTLRVWSGTPEGAIDAPLPRPQLALLRFPELNQRRYEILYRELVAPEVETRAAETWAREFYARTRMTMLSAAGIDRMDWAPGALNWVAVGRTAVLREEREVLRRIRAHAEGLAALLEDTRIEDGRCQAEGRRTRCSMVLRSRAAVEPVALVAGGRRVPLPARRFYPQFATAPNPPFPGRFKAVLAAVPQAFALDGAHPGALLLVWRNVITGREIEVPFAPGAPAAPAPAYSFAAPAATAPAAPLRLGPGRVVLHETLESALGQAVEIAAGTRVQLAPGVSIVARGPLRVYGTPSQPVVFERLDPRSPWGGVAVLGSGRDRPSTLAGCRFDGGSYPALGAFVGTGMLHVAHARGLVLADCRFSRGGGGGDDAVHLSQVSDAALRDLVVEHAERDCIDLDFTTARLERVTAAHCGNDALDLGDSVVEARRSSFGPARDKALSAGDRSAVWLTAVTLREADVGVLVKDVAQVYVDPAVRFDRNRTDVFGYRRSKTAERGGCVVSAVPSELNASLEDDSRLLRVESLRDFARAWATTGAGGPCWSR